MKHRQEPGFTLIELMVTVAIVGILASIAYPSYQNSITKSRRTDATGALLGFANFMERRFTERNHYCDAADTSVGSAAVTGCGTTTNDTGTPLAYATTSPLDGGTAYYNLTIQDATSSTYILRATPTGAQTGNGILQLTQSGVRNWDRNNDGDFLDTNETNWN